MKNKDHFTFPEFDKDHFEYKHDGASTSISHMLIYAKKYAKNAFYLITRKCFIFMKNKGKTECSEFYKDNFEYQHDGASTSIFRIC